VGNAEFIDSENNLVITGRKKTALIGVHDLVVVDTGDALLLCDTDQTERVNLLVKKLKEEKNPLADYHLEVHRPWGSYVDLERSGSYRIKRVTVKPGEKLSLQFHHHRSEHWVVVSGMADVELDGKVIKLSKGQSTFVPAGITHSLGNSGRIPLEVIEVQIGEYLEEDDITRLRDNYNRV
jgi:mannose-1-phosphate guanylyltransferase/mannose-6-phosphate isomerase